MVTFNAFCAFVTDVGQERREREGERGSGRRAGGGRMESERGVRERGGKTKSDARGCMSVREGREREGGRERGQERDKNVKERVGEERARGTERYRI